VLLLVALLCVAFVPASSGLRLGMVATPIGVHIAAQPHVVFPDLGSVPTCMRAGGTEITAVVDTGASLTFFKDQAFYHMYEHEERRVSVADGAYVTYNRSGQVRATSPSGKTITLENIPFVPSFSQNLFSIVQAVDAGYKVLFDATEVVIYKEGEAGPRLSGRRVGSQWLLVLTPTLPHHNHRANVAHATIDNNFTKWHCRLGHVNLKDLKRMRDQGLGPQFTDREIAEAGQCTACIKGKMHKAPFRGSKSLAKDRLELVHTDKHGPFPTQSIGGSLYFTTFHDDSSKFGKVYFNRRKDETDDNIAEYQRYSERETECKLKCVSHDGELGYVHSTTMDENGVAHRTTTPHTPESGGRHERYGKTILEMGLTLRISAALPPKFWAESINTAVYLKNRIPHSSIQHDYPIHLWTPSKRFDVGRLWSFGCLAWVHVPAADRSKLDLKAKPCVFLGYCDGDDKDGGKAYRLWSLEDSKLVRSRNVTFNEKVKAWPWFHQGKGAKEPVNKNSEIHDLTELIGSLNHEPEQKAAIRPPSPPPSPLLPDIHNSPIHSPVHTPPALRRSNRDNRGVIHLFEAGLNDQNALQASPVPASSGDPDNVREARAHAYAEQWEGKMEEELSNLTDIGTWEIVDSSAVPEGRRLVKCRWVFKRTVKEGKPVKFRSRLTACGYAQVKDVDYFEVYAPVARRKSVRILMAFAAHFGGQLAADDISHAFVYGDLDEEIYMRPPPGFLHRYKGKVLKLKKGLYGLKQAARQWYVKFTTSIKKCGFKQCLSDDCVFWKRNDDGSLSLLVLWVDDVLGVYADKKTLADLRAKLQKEYKMTADDNVPHFLGMEVERHHNNTTITLTQKRLILDILESTHMTRCNPAATPMEEKCTLSAADSPQTREEEIEMESVPYRSVLGKLMYLVALTRPDLEFSVKKLAEFQAKPGPAHWQGIKRILRYLNGTKDLGITFGGHAYDRNDPLEPVAYVDSDHANCVDTRRSYTGYVIMFGGGPITWLTRKQGSVATGTMMAEYVALSEVVKDALWLSYLFREVEHKLDHPMLIYEDNLPAIDLAHQGGNHKNSKHIDIRYHFVREYIANQTIAVTPISSSDNIADFFTKPLGKILFRKHRKTIMNIQ
jgi:hypothetical protein